MQGLYFWRWLGDWVVRWLGDWGNDSYIIIELENKRMLVEYLHSFKI